MSNCKVPKCFETAKKTCIVPNPWIIFTKSVKGIGLTKEEKEDQYKKFLKKYEPIKKSGDNKAYRAALCLNKHKKNKKVVIRTFLKRLMKERKEINMGCDIPPNLVKFFEMFVPSAIVGSTLNKCQVIAKYMLKKCVDKKMLKYFTFQNTINYGSYGLLISGTYRKTPVAIKIIPVHSTRSFSLAFSTNYSNAKLNSVPSRNIKREIALQKIFHEKLGGGFHVPKIYGDVSIIKSRKNPNQEIAVFVMEQITKPKPIGTIPQEVRHIKSVPEILRKIHSQGLVHGDLHVGNFLSTRKKSYVIDFGRSMDLTKTRNLIEQDKVMLKLMDYIIGLEPILRNVNAVGYKDDVKVLRSFINAIEKSAPNKKEFDDLLASVNDANFVDNVRCVLAPISRNVSLQEIKKRYECISNLRFKRFYSKQRYWSQVLDF